MATVGMIPSLLPPTSSHSAHHHHVDAFSELGVDQAFGLHTLSVLLSAISLLVTCTALYLFLCSRRNFRHDLILLLISSDILKSLSFFLFPLFTLTLGPIPSTSPLCQATGFFLTLGFEASDISILLIATHALLSVLRPAPTGGPNGIYLYRHYAYALMVIFPVTVASLAFANTEGAYVNTGEFCYLPAHPLWLGLLLSWIPRIITFLGIFALYLFIYTYVRGILKHYDATSLQHHRQKTAFLSQVSSLPSYQLDVVRPLPPIAYYRLIPASQRPSSINGQPRAGSDESLLSVGTPTEGKDHSVSFTNLFNNNTNSIQRLSREIKFNMPDFGDRPYRQRLNSEPETVALDLLVSASLTVSPSQIKYDEIDPLTVNMTTSAVSTSRELLLQTSSTRWLSLFTLRPVFRSTRGSYSSSATLLNSSSRGAFPSATQLNTPPNIIKARTRIFGQLRLLFIYPIIYISLWILPFATSMSRLHASAISSSNKPIGAGSKAAPFALVIGSMISLCIQGVVDTTLFLWREKPWNERVSGGWWGEHRDGEKMMGRTREEMLADERIARMRWRQEVKERNKMGVEKVVRAGSRHWWDAEAEEEGQEVGNGIGIERRGSVI